MSGKKSLVQLFCQNNKLTKLNISGDKALMTLLCFDNQLTSLDLSSNTSLQTLYCYINRLKALDLSGNPDLGVLYCSDNPLTVLNVSTNKKLKELWCDNCSLKNLDTSGNPELVSLTCMNNQLTALNLSANTKLVFLYCGGNKIIKLNILKNTALEYLGVENNQLAGLSFENNPKLMNLWAEGNPLKEVDLTGTALAEWLRDSSNYTTESSDTFDPSLKAAIGYFIPDQMIDWSAREASFDLDDIIIALDTPAVTASGSSSGVSLSWTAPEGAIKYEILRKNENGEYDLIFTAKTTSYTDTGAPYGKLAYRLRAVNGMLYSKYANVSVGRSPFTDVSPDASYLNAVVWAAEGGIVKGTTATTFSPDATCTRYQFAVMLYKLHGKPAVSGTMPFTDVQKTDTYYKAVLWAYQNGIISGTTPTTFSPKRGVLRYQAVQMLYKSVGKPAVSAGNPFVDVASNASYYRAVLWAVENGITKGTDATHFSPNAACKRYQLVVFLYKFNNIYHIK